MALSTCTDDFARLSAPVPGIRCDANPFVSFADPFGLANWTFPVIEVTLIVGAVAGLVHAVHRLRARGDSSNLVLWVALVIGLLFVEPITYFPQWFGLQDSIGLVFMHGKFSVNFLFDRLPLYIVAMYPFFGYLSYVLVQQAGILRRFGIFVSSCAIAVGFFATFEVIDTVGPQWGWWRWNAENPIDSPSLGAVPIFSLQLFSLAVPFGVAVATLLVHRRLATRGPWIITRNALIVSVAMWPVMMISLVPTAIVQGVGVSTDIARPLVAWTLIVGAHLVAAYAFIRVWFERRRGRTDGLQEGHDVFGPAYVAVYLVVCLVVWGAALPDYLDRTDGVTPEGMPVGSLPMGIVAFVVSSGFAILAWRLTSPRRGGIRSLTVGGPKARETRVEKS